MAQKLKYIEGLVPLLLNFAILEGSIDDEFEKAELLAQEYTFEKMRANISLTCHSLKDLRALDHPYAKRDPQPIHRPQWLVHLQDGTLVNALEKTGEDLSDGTKIRSVGIDESKAPHATDIIYGTSKMVGRDFITETFAQVESTLMGFYEAAQQNALKHFE